MQNQSKMNFREGLRAGLILLVIYLFMPLMGWWVGGSVLWPPPLAELLGSFLAEPVRAVYGLAACAVALVSGWLNASFPISSQGFLPRPWLLHWRNIAFETILVLGPFCDRRDLLVMPDSSMLRWGGVILFISGVALSMWANELLSRAALAWQSAPYEPILLVEGPFKYLRYPVYLGQLVCSLGAALLFRSWIGLASFLLMINFILMRIREEEERARAKHGIQWSAYRRHSWKLLPYIF